MLSIVHKLTTKGNCSLYLPVANASVSDYTASSYRIFVSKGGILKGTVYLGECEVEVRDFPKPNPGPGEVLVQMKAAGFCGSDLHKYRQSREWACGRKGMISGHEPAGLVVELGPGVTNVTVGDRVSVYHSLGCGHCRYCLAGKPVFCDEEGAFGRTRDGCHADFMLTPSRYCLPLPAEFSFPVGAMLACTAGTAFASVNKLPKTHGETLVIFGLGPIGLSCLLIGKAMGFRCIGVEVNDFRLSLAQRLGAEVVINARESDPVNAILDLTHGKGAPAILECSGNAAARRQTVKAAAIHATIVIVGAGSDEISFDQLAVISRELTIRGNSVYSMPSYFEAIRFLRIHPLPLDEMVTHRFTIEDAPRAFTEFNGGSTGKVIFEWP